MKLSKTHLKHLTTSLACIALVLASLALNFRSAVAVPPADGPYLFADAAVEADLASDDPTIVRTRLVHVDWGQLAWARALAAQGGYATDQETQSLPTDSGSALLYLNLFPDVLLTAVLERVEANATNGFTWIGHVAGVEGGQVILAVEEGVMAGNVALRGAFYQVRYVGDGLHAVHEIDRRAFPSEADPIPVDLPDAPSIEALDVSAKDDGSLVDVMVVYTGAARQAVGGSMVMNVLIDLAVGETNVGYANSGITQRMRLVHTAEVTYDESNFDWSTTLSRLRGTADGYMDDAHPLRDTYAADLVVLIVSQTYSNYCGIAYLMTTPSPSFEAWSFSVVAWQCATGYYTFAHEAGHNMGCHHDRANASSEGVYPYSYGYQAPDRAFRTVMAYNCSGGCPRINHWSNPDVAYGGQPTGVAHTAPNSADNRLSLNNTAYTVANWRTAPSGPPAAPSGLAAVLASHVQNNLSWTDNSDNENGFKIERSPNSTSNWTQIATVGANVASYGDSGLACGTTYDYRVRAYNADGDSAYSDVDEATTASCTPVSPSCLVAAPASETRISLSWTDNSSNESEFQIERSPNGTSNWTQIATVGADVASYGDTGLTKETTYYYRVRAHNAYGDSAHSNTDEATTMSYSVYLPAVQRNSP